MLILDELKRNDPQLRLLAVALAAGLCTLLAGLWWVQIVSTREYQGHLEMQSYRTVRLPAIRGKILDRDGRPLAENRPRYNLSLYLDDLRKPFDTAYGQLRQQALASQKQALAAEEKRLGRSLTKAERKQFTLTAAQREQYRQLARYRVASGIVSQISQDLEQPLTFDPAKFERDYKTRLALPYTVIPDASPGQVARFEEKFTSGLGADLDLQPVRIYPWGATAGHLLGYLQRDDSSVQGEEAYFSYRLPDYRGVTGIEWGFDPLLRGHAGGESVLVNSQGYRQSENILDAPEPGHNVVLTIDLDIERAAEKSIAAHQGVNALAAAVVMDVRTGDVLAMVSSPSIDPNYFVGALSAADFQNETERLSDPKLRPQINRATQENYAPGSIFKSVVGLAALDNGLDPNEIYTVQSDPTRPGRGCIYVGHQKVEDTVMPGDYNFKRAIVQSSNAYFIFNGLRTGIDKIVRLAAKFHFGERVDLPTRQETKGIFPTVGQVKRSDWRDGDSANIYIGQGQMAVTPMQIAVAYSAIANGGKILWPRLVARIEPQDPASGETITNFPPGLVRDEIDVKPQSLKILHEAMLAETEDSEGTGREAVVPGLRICGKTGTAQVKNVRGELTGWNYWFASFAPYENPRYAVVVMVQSQNHGSGGVVCAPIAHDIYAEILKKEISHTPQVAETK